MSSPTEAERIPIALNADAADSFKRDCINKPLAAVVLPGYDAGIDDLGVQHSRSKLTESASRLFATLASIQSSQLHPSSHLSEQDVGATSIHPRSSIIGGLSKGCIHTFHCSEESETWTYRCRCNFQIVRVDPDGAPSYRYAMRSMGEPVLLGTKNNFPIATQRIQTAMEEFMAHLNNDDNDQDIVGQNGHLTSCTFSSAWSDMPNSDCVLTLHYDQPLDDGENSKELWIRQSRILCQKMKLRQLNGRSKGTLLSVRGRETLKSTEKCDDDDETEATIRDTIYLLRTSRKDSTNANNIVTREGEWKVALHNSPPSDRVSTVVIPVHYDKPETAFYHPNANAMTTALSWMLNRLASISSSLSTDPDQKLNLLEMYCGCGAHTVALGRSGLVSNIIAVELDPRLVRACKANIAKNSLEDLVEVRKGDAGRWAKEESRKRRSKKARALAGKQQKGDIETSSNQENYYDVLLVDPPRQGLDEEVCKMAMMSIDGEIGSGESCFRNLLYVSCGHKALLRDLERLSPVYEVVNCAQMDLFPRTDSIETLVHLQRRTVPKQSQQ